MNQRPSGYEPDELPGCSTPQSGVLKNGAPDRSRTCNPQIRSLILYPVELQALESKTVKVYHNPRGVRKGEFFGFFFGVTFMLLRLARSVKADRNRCVFVPDAHGSPLTWQNTGQHSVRTQYREPQRRCCSRLGYPHAGERRVALRVKAYEMTSLLHKETSLQRKMTSFLSEVTPFQTLSSVTETYFHPHRSNLSPAVCEGPHWWGETGVVNISML